MTTVNTQYGSGSGSVVGNESPRQAVNLSDAAQMENTFITLMTAQIQNQDPTNPLDGTEFLNQFSAMSQVKSLENMAALTRNNLILMDNLQTLTAAGLVGQEVKVQVERLQLSDQVVSGRINQQHASGQTLVRLTDGTGQTHEIRLGGQAAGAVNFEIDPQALGLSPGHYLIEVETDTGEYPQVEVAGTVAQVRVSDEGPVLEIAGVGSVPFYLITEFGQQPLAGLM
ncbi:flagellar basal body rod modification protein [Pseudomonas sp. WN033]|nr:flagellar basal body rod modification protein [Pseudomonas sp. WN033]